MTEVRALDDADFARWYAVYAESYSRSFDAPWLEAEKRVNLTDDEYVTKTALGAWHDGDLVGGGAVLVPQKDNLELAYVDLFIHPDHRRRGHGGAVLDAILAVAHRHDRSRIFAETVWDVAESTGPGRDFLLARGSTIDLVDAVRELRLPAVVPAAPVAEGYELHSWRGACPEVWMPEYADLRRRMNAEAPSGEVGLEPEHWDAERVRRDEDDAARSGRSMQVTIARSAAGTLAGHSQLSIPNDSLEVYQWDTLVLAEHRGHGLGLSMKAENMRAAADLIQGRSRIMTYNAASNAPMIAVNEALGFRQVAWSAEHLLQVQKR